MSSKVSDIKAACTQVLLNFADGHPHWKYTKSKQAFVCPVGKNASVEFMANHSSKVDFVNFQFGIGVADKIVKRVNELRSMPKPYSDTLLYWHRQKWAPDILNGGRCTVYDHRRPDLAEYEALRAQGKKNYVRLEEFPDYLSAIAQLAEVEIGRLFDVSSEEALVRSILAQPMGVFPSEQMLITNLLIGHPDYYRQLVAYYAVPYEDRPYKTGGPFYQQGADQLMDIYQEGNFPRFDFLD